MTIIAYFSINTTTGQHIKMTRTAGRWMVSAVNSSTTVEVKYKGVRFVSCRPDFVRCHSPAGQGVQEWMPIEITKPS